ncbi:ClpX C4-type zinc finger protein [Yersinia aleksiciae]|uniref:ClpX C4-type zinc finger protein n=1 Tax=Yersinia aleksiciae TaxID=263819 RepID=UPI001427BAD5|nr:ClpX C4-type zinc finger protein [Yersinia aleksiciae]MDA5499961.1 hypothetical protein [Yersinia aleksiciae]NIL01319.1 hypothetical protein [Yersinia aleksiciae]WQC69804.1 ClpX C4-type zinc finger protein [Yersinia aleksiciae]
MDISGVNEKGNVKVFCSFCEKPSDELTYLVASKFAAICSDCIALSVKIIADKASQNTAAKSEIVSFGREILQGTVTVRFENAPKGITSACAYQHGYDTSKALDEMPNKA